MPGVPADATAAVLTVTVVNRSGYNFVSVYPAGAAVPEASNLNTAVHDEVAANLVTVQLGAGGAVDLDAFDLCDVVVDLAGVYVPAPTGLARGGRFVALPSAVRVIDTRSTAVLLPGESVVVDVTSVVPADASSVVINLTTTGTLSWGYFTCYPLDAAGPSETSNLNVNGPDQTRAAAAVVKVTTVGGVRGFKVWSYGGGHVIVDVAGYYTGDASPMSSSGLFVPMPPQRILDTRKPGAIGRLWPRWMVETAIPDPARTDAQAIVANVTAVDARGAGWFTVLAARTPMQVVSNVNVVAEHDNVPNHVISRISTAGLAVYSQSGAHVIVDMAGYFTGTPAVPTEGPYANPPPPPIGPPWLLNIPRLGLSSWVVRLAEPVCDRQRRAQLALDGHRFDGGVRPRVGVRPSHDARWDLPQHPRARARRRDVRRHDGQPPLPLPRDPARPDELGDEQHLVRDAAVRRHVAVADRVHEAELSADEHRLPDHRHGRAGRLGRAVAVTVDSVVSSASRRRSWALSSAVAASGIASR